MTAGKRSMAWNGLNKQNANQNHIYYHHGKNHAERLNVTGWGKIYYLVLPNTALLSLLNILSSRCNNFGMPQEKISNRFFKTCKMASKKKK